MWRCVSVCECNYIKAVWDSLYWAASCMLCWGGPQKRRGPSIIHPTCHQGNLPWGGQGSVRTSGNLWGVNFNRRETTTEGWEEGNEEDDRWHARLGERKVLRESGQWRERERWQERWQVIVAKGVTGSSMQTEKGCWGPLIFHTRLFFSHLKGSL